NGATAYLNGGSFATPPTVTGNGGSMMVESGANLSNLSASNYGTAVLDSGSLTQTATGGSGGTIVANSGAQGNSIVLSGGQGTVLSGANFSSMNILAGGNGIASNGASLDWMYVSSGNGTLQSGATVQHLRIQPGGSGFLMSGASALDITVASGGWISGAVVKAGNSMSVASAGTAINTIVTDSSANAGANPTTILSGGSAINTVLAGANPTGGTAALGGLLTIQSGANLSNTSMGYNARLRVLGLQYDKGGTTYLSGGTLHVIENGQEWTTTLQGSYHGKNASDSGFILLDDGQGNTIVAYDQCFLAGTLIRLEQGDVAIEDIQKGDLVRVLSNGQEELREITNVMKRHAHVHTDLPKDMAGWSVKIDKDAFAEGVPSQDLSVTPEHCFYFDGRFVPAR
ncbi:Hint domain-containing protein, partial [Saccharibacter floricola]|uniref:Hint domain-containing protein n=1 Tax=Saccharibacter floricola TaxID=231053 RepID=UPI00035FDD67